MVWYVLFFYFVLCVFLFFVPYGSWNYSCGFNDFFSFSVSFSFEVCLFFLVLIFVSFFIFVYGSFYMVGGVRLFYFFLVLFSFVMSMGGLIVFSNCVILTLVFWDFLGVSSFFLVLFYNNVVGRCGAMSTVFTNRIGDFSIFLFFNGLILFSVGFLSCQFFSSLVGVMLFVSSFIKGGQYPFGSWLPKAMAAPTPVSCLVHSSTLVTAGLMLMDFYSYVSLGSDFLLFVFFFGFLTVVVSGCCALVESDCKKVVALSTMSQMGFCFLCIGCGLHYVSFVHMIGHSFFKSLLFMQVGYLIFVNFGQQDFRGYSFFGFCVPYLVCLNIYLCVVCLCGLMYTSGYCSKEYFVSCFYCGSYSVLLAFFYFFGVFLTFCYCYRMLFLFRVEFCNYGYVGFSSKLYYLSCCFLVFFSVCFIFWWFFNFLNFVDIFNRIEFFVVFFYFFFLFCVLNYFFKFFVLEFCNKFFMDNYSFFVYKLIPNFWFFELIGLGFNYFLFGLLRFFFFSFFMLFRGVYGLVVVFVISFMLLLFFF
uniref:NADH dehydrogenase subunit 5 n=1 Tax=Tetrameres grusi TaxID=1911024 RepID=UPI001FCDB53F|nr:NADH dehydrogenase subunit 5 [Tetrameres grusi]UNY39755.1 NADH dehydrogenase subunit 5 [Tetrameres grusi]